MKYLLYLRDGQVKKFPLKKDIILLGREPGCDFYIDEDFISKQHARITCFENHIKVEDLKSKNGVYVEHLKINEAQISLDESFKIGYLEFYIKKGNPEEFVLSAETLPVIKKISNLISTSHEDTKTCLNLFDKTLITILRLGFKINHFGEILEWGKISLTNTLKTGLLMVLTKEDKEIKVISGLKLDENTDFVLDRVDLSREIFEKEILNQRMGEDVSFYSFPIPLSMRKGALLYIRKGRKRLEKKALQFLGDFSNEVSLISRLLEKNKSFYYEEDAAGSLLEVVTRDESMLNVLNKCKKIAPANLFVLIEGETGTGKELAARFIHYNSLREKNKYIAINCSAIPESLLEDELFGHEKGAFTGAHSRRSGKLEHASAGTLVLDEIGEMSLDLQKKLLRVLQESKFYRIGGNERINVNLRLISLTNKDLLKLVKKNLFREDLYYRIAHVRIEIPPLRERKHDIQPLINHFFEKFSLENRIYVSGFSQLAIEALQNYSWPGNVRELENEIKSLVNQSSSGDIIDFDLLKNEIKAHYRNLKGNTTAPDGIDHERERILELLRTNKWNKAQVARKLNISRTALYKKIKKLNIQ
jgi:two-component system response regulator AtoC